MNKFFMDAGSSPNASVVIEFEGDASVWLKQGQFDVTNKKAGLAGVHGSDQTIDCQSGLSLKCRPQVQLTKMARLIKYISVI